MSVAIALSSAALANSAIATAAAEAARKTACEALMQTFDPRGASDAAMRSYADCVNLLLPVASGPTPLVIRILVATLILSFFAGAVYGWLTPDEYESRVDRSIMFGFVGAFFWLLVVLIIAGIALVFL